MNREGAPGKSPEEVYIQQKVRVLLIGEDFLRTYAGVVNSRLTRRSDGVSRSEAEDRRQKLQPGWNTLEAGQGQEICVDLTAE
ncbi:hypothetical protein FD754_016738 [Muntiacus muntjak]|uniref:Uncharacterized protein n=1 Tax=Muntiacus muntjak TaxID=9888 RepID=A0A5N3VRI9_MUNMU|nr:hypothetical protein FD754_016738 [Muntiacus muntjak]